MRNSFWFSHLETKWNLLDLNCLFSYFLTTSLHMPENNQKPVLYTSPNPHSFPGLYKNDIIQDTFLFLSCANCFYLCSYICTRLKCERRKDMSMVHCNKPTQTNENMVNHYYISTLSFSSCLFGLLLCV